MSSSALILAAHGCRVDPSVNAMVSYYADRMATMDCFDDVTAAFHQGVPNFATVLDELTAERITIVPLMTSEGYFSEVVLPRGLKRNTRYPEVTIRRTKPVGTHPGVADLVVNRVRHRLWENALDPSDTTLAVVGHGTGRHARSKDATCGLVDALRRRDVCGEVLSAFLDEEPRVETICRHATRRNILVVAFMIGGGPHSTRDLPKRLGIVHGDRAPGPPAKSALGRFVSCDTAVGSDPGILEIVAQLARSGPN